MLCKTDTRTQAARSHSYHNVFGCFVKWTVILIYLICDVLHFRFSIGWVSPHWRGKKTLLDFFRKKPKSENGKYNLQFQYSGCIVQCVKINLSSLSSLPIVNDWLILKFRHIKLLFLQYKKKHMELILSRKHHINW